MVQRKAGRTTSFPKIGKQIIRQFFDHRVSKSACALAYNLLFAMFPFLIFISNLLGLLDLNVNSIVTALRPWMPKDAVDLVGAYLNYVSDTSSTSLFWFSLGFTVFFPMRAASGLMDNVRTAYQLGKPKNPVSYFMRQLIVTLALLAAVIFTLLLSTFGRRVLGMVVKWLPGLATLKTPHFLLTLWHYLRFVIVYVFVMLALGLFYAAAQDKPQGLRAILPGILAASVGWVVVSMGFSFYVENFSRYSIIYGALGAVIVLLTWLYMTALALIMGAEINAARKVVLENQCEES
mgnify:CR=1 FL=1